MWSFIKKNKKKIIVAYLLIVCLLALSISLIRCSNTASGKANIYDPSGQYIELEKLDFAGWCNFYGYEADNVNDKIEQYFNKYIAPANTRKAFYIETARYTHVLDCLLEHGDTDYFDDILAFREGIYNHNEQWDDEFNYGPTPIEEFKEYSDIDDSKSTWDIMIQLLETLFTLNEKYEQSVNLMEFFSAKERFELDDRWMLYDQVPVEKRLCIEDYFRFKQELPEFNKWFESNLKTIIIENMGYDESRYRDFELDEYIEMNWLLRVYNATENTNYDDIKVFVEAIALEGEFYLPYMYDENGEML